jgi:hypothetical protein
MPTFPRSSGLGTGDCVAVGRARFWVHGGVTPSNLLVRDSRRAFHEGIAPDDGTWARGRGWALWKALVTLARADVGDVRSAAARFGWRTGLPG